MMTVWSKQRLLCLHGYTWPLHDTQPLIRLYFWGLAAMVLWACSSCLMSSCLPAVLCSVSMFDDPGGAFGQGLLPESAYLCDLDPELRLARVERQWLVT
jgi:hypothetical protein